MLCRILLASVSTSPFSRDRIPLGHELDSLVKWCWVLVEHAGDDGCSNHFACNRDMGKICVGMSTIDDYAGTYYSYTRLNTSSVSNLAAQQTVQQRPQWKRPTTLGSRVGGKKKQRSPRTRRRDMACVSAYHTWRIDGIASNSPQPKPKMKILKKSAENTPLQKSLLFGYELDNEAFKNMCYANGARL